MGSAIGPTGGVGPRGDDTVTVMPGLDSTLRRSDRSTTGEPTSDRLPASRSGARERRSRQLRVSTTRPFDRSCERGRRCADDRPYWRTLITPGVVDRASIHAYTYGQCHALARAIHELTERPIVAIHDAHHAPTSGHLDHLMIRLHDGRLFDVKGTATTGDVLDRFPGRCITDIAVADVESLHRRAGRDPWVETLLVPNMSAARATALSLLSAASPHR